MPKVYYANELGEYDNKLCPNCGSSRLEQTSGFVPEDSNISTGSSWICKDCGIRIELSAEYLVLTDPSDPSLAIPNFKDMPEIDWEQAKSDMPEKLDAT